MQFKSVGLRADKNGKKTKTQTKKTFSGSQQDVLKLGEYYIEALVTALGPAFHKLLPFGVEDDLPTSTSSNQSNISTSSPSSLSPSSNSSLSLTSLQFPSYLTWQESITISGPSSGLRQASKSNSDEQSHCSSSQPEAKSSFVIPPQDG
jgi:hypothetical protein